MSSINSDEVVIFSIDGEYGGEVNDSRSQFNEGHTYCRREYFDIAGTNVSNQTRGLILDVYRVEMDILAKLCGGSLWFSALPHRAGSLTKVTLQTSSRKKLRHRIVFPVSKRGAQRNSHYQDKSKSHSHGSILVMTNVEATGARPMIFAKHCRSRVSGGLPG
jgi:hypothetical protein